MPRLQSARPVIVALAIGALFTAKLVLNPFYTSFNPGEHAKAGPLRLLPVELTLLNDLPVSAQADRARRTLAGTPPVSAYLVDDGVFPPEGETFWVRGGSRADVVLRAPIQRGPDERVTSLRVRSWQVEITNGHAANRVRVASRGGGESFSLAPGEVRTIELGAGAGVPYKPAQVPDQLHLPGVDQHLVRVRAISRRPEESRQPVSRRDGPAGADLLHDVVSGEREAGRGKREAGSGEPGRRP